MKKTVILIAALLVVCNIEAQETWEQAIRNTMADQEVAWNKGNLEAFMEGYWKSDSLRFIGSKGLTYGWQQTLDNYKKGYPDADAMGQLKFTILSVEQMADNCAFVVGKWQLTRKKGDVSGHYTLLSSVLQRMHR